MQLITPGEIDDWGRLAHGLRSVRDRLIQAKLDVESLFREPLTITELQIDNILYTHAAAADVFRDTLKQDCFLKSIPR